MARPENKTVYIAVMGVTGSGKSTFIQHCTEGSVTIGHNLLSCTQKVNVFDCHMIPGVTVKLVDTPGFDDSSRSDTDVLKEIAKYLAATYKNGTLLHGIVYVHRISDNRMPGSARKNLRMFKTLCGPQVFRHVVLATTRWEDVDLDTGMARERELCSNGDFWGFMIERGSRVERHFNTEESARRLIQLLVSNASEISLDLQTQMVDQKKQLAQTNAGKTLDGELAAERRKFEKERDQLKKDVADAKKEKDVETARILQEQKDIMDRKLRELDKARNDLKTSIEREYEQKYRELQREMRAANEVAQRRATQQEQLLRDERERHQRERDEDRREMQRLTEQFSSANLRASREQDSQLEMMRRETRSLQQQLARSSTVSRAATPSGSGVRLDLADIKCISLSGSHVFLTGAKRSRWKMPRDFTAEALSPDERFTFVALGEDDSWIAFYKTRDGDCRGYRTSDNFDDLYSGLTDKIDESEDYKAPKCLTLGVRGRYFVKPDRGAAWWRLGSDDLDGHDKHGLRYLWLGYGGAFIGITREGELFWNLKGGYSKLDERLSGTRRAPQLVALNLENDESYLAVWENGGYSRGGRVGRETTDLFLQEHGYKDV